MDRNICRVLKEHCNILARQHCVGGSFRKREKMWTLEPFPGTGIKPPGKPKYSEDEFAKKYDEICEPLYKRERYLLKRKHFKLLMKLFKTNKYDTFCCIYYYFHGRHYCDCRG